MAWCGSTGFVAVEDAQAELFEVGDDALACARGGYPTLGKVTVAQAQDAEVAFVLDPEDGSTWVIESS